MRNIMARVPHKLKKSFLSLLELIWKQPTREDARRIAKQVVDQFGAFCPEAIDTLEEGLEDSLKYYDYPRISPSRISSTNHLERLNREIRRRTKVITVFPHKESYLWLVVAYLLEYEEDSCSDKSYIAPDRIVETFLIEKELQVA